VNLDVDTKKVYISDPRVYAVKNSDPDMPSLNEALLGEYSEQYLEEMKKEGSALTHQKT